MSRKLDVVGRRFGALTALHYAAPVAAPSGELRRVLFVRCDCGVEKTVAQRSLVSGQIASCGCVMRQKGSRAKHWKGFGGLPQTYWNNCRNNAERRGIDFLVGMDEAWALYERQQRCCALTGLPIEFGRSSSASLDRIDSSVGYVIDNVQWVHKDVNLMKNKLDQNYFLALCKAIAARAA